MQRLKKSNNRTSKAQFAATLEQPIKIQGAEYSAVDTKDGWYTLKDVLFFAEVPKGEKNAPEDVKAPRMQQMVNAALTKYENEKFAAPAHKGHHKIVAFEDPEFLGFMLPKRVGRIVLDGRDQDAVFGDVKVKANAFQRIKNGELPYVSPEVDWSTWTFSSLAFLDSMPPHFKGPIITVGKVTEDSTAKFTVGSTISKGQFMSISEKGDKKEEAADEKKHNRDLKKVKDDERDDTAVDGGHNDGGDRDGGGEHDEAKMCAHCHERMNRMEASYGSMDKSMADIHFKMGLPYKGAQMEANRAPVKSDSSAPVEDEKGKTMSDKKESTGFANDPEVRAKFAALEMQNKALEERLNKRDADEAVKARVSSAFEQLKGYPLTDTVKADIAEFAKDEALLKKYVAAIQAQTPKNPPRTVAEFESSGKEVKLEIAGNDPDLAAFQAKGPEAMEAALKYAARFEAMKNDKACRGSKLVQEGRKAFIEFHMEMDPTGNFGRKKVS